MRLLLAPFVALFAFVRRMWTRWTWERFLDGLRKTDDERVYPERDAQRESFVFGNCNIDNPYVTREMVSRAVPCPVCHRAGDHKLQCPRRNGQGLRIPAKLYAVPSDETTQRSARDVAPVTEGEALDYVERNGRVK